MLQVLGLPPIFYVPTFTRTNPASPMPSVGTYDEAKVLQLKKKKKKQKKKHQSSPYYPFPFRFLLPSFQQPTFPLPLHRCSHSSSFFVFLFFLQLRPQLD